MFSRSGEQVIFKSIDGADEIIFCPRIFCSLLLVPPSGEYVFPTIFAYQSIKEPLPRIPVLTPTVGSIAEGLLCDIGWEPIRDEKPECEFDKGTTRYFSDIECYYYSGGAPLSLQPPPLRYPPVFPILERD